MSYKRNLSYQGWYNFLNIVVEDIGTNSEIILQFYQAHLHFFCISYKLVMSLLMILAKMSCIQFSDRLQTSFY
jgi:hypothetical protein